MTEKHKTLYLAHRHARASELRKGLLAELKTELETLGAQVVGPFDRDNELDRENEGWEYQVAQTDFREMRGVDGVFAVLNGCPPDDVVMEDLKRAFVWSRWPIFLFRDDCRYTSDEERPVNEKLLCRIPSFKYDFWFRSIEEVKDQNKTLARWLGGERVQGEIYDLLAGDLRTRR